MHSQAHSLLPHLLTLSLLTLLTPHFLHTAQAQDVLLSFGRVDYFIQPSVITLECVGNGEKVHYWREVNNITYQVNGSSPTQESGTMITLVVTPDVEGEYYCTINGVASKRKEVVAYPLQNKSINALRHYSIPLRSNIQIPCVFTPGEFSERYTIAWFKGSMKIDFTDPRFKINNDFSLSISSANAFDASSAYYCEVSVESRGHEYRVFSNTGPSVELAVVDSLSITQHLTDIITNPPTHQPPAIFTCEAFGLPKPAIMWLHRGNDITVVIKTEELEEEEGYFVRSEIELGGEKEGESGVVECIVIQRRRRMEEERAGEEVAVAMSSMASLVVLPSNFEPSLLPTGSGLELSLSLPTLLPASFSLVIYYYSADNSQIRKLELVDPAFSHTQQVEYVIPRDEIPDDVSFVRVSVKVGTEEGKISQASNAVNLSSSSSSSSTTSSPTVPQSCDCSGNQSTVQTILVIFIVFLIMLLSCAMAMAIWSLVLMVKRSKLKKSNSVESFEDKRRSYSPSHRSSRSPSHSQSPSYSRSPSNSRSPSPSGSRSSASSGSRSRSVSPGHTGGYLSDRKEPEGRHDDQNSVMSGRQSKTDSTSRLAEQLNSCTALPLPSVPFGFKNPLAVVDPPSLPSPSSSSYQPHKHAENEYEELDFKKGKRRRRGGGGGGGGEGRGGRGKEWVLKDQRSRSVEIVSESMM